MTLRIKNVIAAPVLIVLALSGVTIVCSAKASANNAGPSVKITTPISNSTYSWNSLVNYSVVVSYLGKSTQYQEIPSNQILLKTTYVPDVSKAMDGSVSAAAPPPAGLLDIIRSNCLGCHEFKAKAMGPSFAAIAERYPNNQAAVDILCGYIHNGSTGVWGQASMPPHTEFSKNQLNALVLWILTEAANPNVSYYVGTEGAIRMTAPATPAPRAGLILTASYAAPDPSASPDQAPIGEDTVIVRGK